MSKRKLIPLILFICLSNLSNAAAASAEIWLTSTPECNSCGIFEQAAERRQYGDSLDYLHEGQVLEVPIRRVAKDALSIDILAQLPLELLTGRDWALNLTVLVVDEGRVLQAGNIADSADNLQLRYSDALMFPAASPPGDDPAIAGEDLYTRFSIEQWNLEYFVELALGKRSPRLPARPVDLASPAPLQLARTNVILWGAAEIPLRNSLFIPTRMREIRERLDGLAPDNPSFLTLYGHGPQVPGNDTSYIEDDRIRFKRAELPVDLAADAASLNALFTGLLQQPAKRSLLVQVGHSGRTGSPLWGSGLTVSPEDLAPLREADSKLILVSGACHSGLFAKVGQCGFFAAHPEVVATGCQLSAEALESSDDYLRHFFQADALLDSGAAGLELASLPLNAAHWLATSELEDHQISYSTTDALIDDYFTRHPGHLPPSMTVGKMRQSARLLDAAEQRALAEFTRGLPDGLSVSLTDHVALNHAAQRKLATATEQSSAERNALLALPYKLALPQLARRLAYAALSVQDEDFAAASACEQQSLSEFFKLSEAAD